MPHLLQCSMNVGIVLRFITPSRHINSATLSLEEDHQLFIVFKPTACGFSSGDWLGGFGSAFVVENN